MLSKLSRWQFLSWWRKTAMIAVGTTIIAGLLVFSIATLVAAEPNSATVRWLAVAVLPMFVVVVMGSIARLQNRIDQRGGQPKDHNERTAG